MNRPVPEYLNFSYAGVSKPQDDLQSVGSPCTTGVAELSSASPPLCVAETCDLESSSSHSSAQDLLWALSSINSLTGWTHSLAGVQKYHRSLQNLINCHGWFYYYSTLHPASTLLSTIVSSSCSYRSSWSSLLLKITFIASVKSVMTDVVPYWITFHAEVRAILSF